MGKGIDENTGRKIALSVLIARKLDTKTDIGKKKAGSLFT